MDERTGEIHDYGKRSGVVISKIFAPTDAPEWTSGRSRLWNMVEKIEARKDAQLCRTWDIALPAELSADQRLALVKKYCLDELVSRGMVVDMSIHAPHRGKETRNHHVHIAASMRDIAPDGFKNKNRAWNRPELIVTLRERWAYHTNIALEQAGHTARIDHRTLEEQGVDRPATIHLGKKATILECRGIETESGRYNRQLQDQASKRRLIKGEQMLLDCELNHINNCIAAITSQLPPATDHTTHKQDDQPVVPRLQPDLIDSGNTNNSHIPPVPLKSTIAELRVRRNELWQQEQKLWGEQGQIQRERWKERRRRRGMLAWLLGLYLERMYKKHIQRLQDRRNLMRGERQRVSDELKQLQQDVPQRGTQGASGQSKPIAASNKQQLEVSAMVVQLITGTNKEIKAWYRAHADEIANSNPTKARALRAICNAELANVADQKVLRLPAPTVELREIRAALKKLRISRDYGRT